MNILATKAVQALVTVKNILNNGPFMKTSIPRFLLLGAALTTLALVSACSQQSSGAQSEPAPKPVVNATLVTNTPAVPVAPVVSAAPEIPVVTTAPAVVPTNIVPTSPLAQVVRLAQAGVDESIIMVYVTNSSRTFNLDADKIVYLTDLGLPTDVVTAMMQQDLKLQQEFAAAQAEQQAQQLPPAQPNPNQAAPEPEPAVASTTETEAPPAPVTADYFNDTLSPYGSWVVVNGYGSCWRPAVCTYNPSWRPYCDRGHWVYSDCGWYWSSDYAWGATFHYGRWFCDSNVGWCWYPDTVWAPSWVTWRYSNNYCGWAPLPPRTYCQAGVGIAYQGSGVSVGLSFGLGASCFTFVPTQYFCSSHPHNYCAPPSQAAQIYNNTTVINDIRIHGSGNNQIVINNGIPVQGVVNATRTSIRPMPVHQIDPAFAHGGSVQPANRPSRVYSGPSGNDNAGPSAQPLGPARSGATASTAGQIPPHSIILSGNGGSRPSQFNPYAVRTQPNVNNPAAAGSQRPMTAGNYRVPGYTAPAQTPAANYNSSSQPVPARWQQPGTPQNYTRAPEPRQNFAVVAPPVTYSAPPQPQPQARNYSQPRPEIRPSYSPAPAVSAPQPSAPSVASAPAPQYQNGARMGNSGWGSH